MVFIKVPEKVQYRHINHGNRNTSNVDEASQDKSSTEGIRQFFLFASFRNAGRISSLLNTKSMIHRLKFHSRVRVRNGLRSNGKNGSVALKGDGIEISSMFC